MLRNEVDSRAIKWRSCCGRSGHKFWLLASLLDNGTCLILLSLFSLSPIAADKCVWQREKENDLMRFMHALKKVLIKTCILRGLQALWWPLVNKFTHPKPFHFLAPQSLIKKQKAMKKKRRHYKQKLQIPEQ